MTHYIFINTVVGVYIIKTKYLKNLKCNNYIYFCGSKAEYLGFAFP